MDIQYISESDDDEIICKSVNNNGNKWFKDFDNLHQILNYPSLQKHSTNDIKSMCDSIDKMSRYSFEYFSL